MPTLEQLGSEKYVLLTTFRKDGRAVPTPLWVVPDAGGLAFWTVAGTGKLKRIRNNGRVTVAACDMRGNPTGEAIEATARIGDLADRLRVGETLKRKYGLIGRLTMLGSRLRRGTEGTVAVLVS
ncbi:PPOX class probable F420-dependent enzyme [Actinoplanes octamycinicus]|uniref:PPOX class probable F420-dependent enzyme n=1 Tax=Actinoplanes octamycinicus TaxID=135948 RepID=A0A7W7GTZ4_9ACTN|nr:PPOX class F420-dependent oxidoreductase [Actinoplanes octamycinicus]MBB4738261.1 PPOX class probable F420-dependent enzyme [Actinoplanes octamycinicus]GIE59178.1 PPOX class F420-dependent oxidoreductase [Actinoplanes octamycinicus]